MPKHFDRRTLIVAAAAAAPVVSTPLSALADEASPIASPGAMTKFPDSSAGQQLAWLFAVINGEEPMPEPEAMAERFAPSFLEAVPPESLIQTLDQMKAAFAPIQLIELVDPQTDQLLNAVFEASDGTKLTITISVEAVEPFLIDGLLFAPYEQEARQLPVFASWAEFEAAIATENGAIGIGASQLVDDELEAVHQSNPDTVFAIGSVFKLYVLAAVADAIESGELAWETEIELTDELLSFPTGITQDEPIGTMVDVKTLATRMISISDNTATDMLMHAVGRDRVEAALETLGNSVQERNRPFLTTREMFLIKLGDEARRDEFAAAGEDARRELLDNIADESLPPLNEVVAWSDPLEIDTIEWFATMPDVERAQAWLYQAATRPGLEPIESVMTTNPGVPFDPDVWTSVAFKGGSEPGVMSLSWLLQRADGERFTFAVTINDPSAGLEETTIAMAAAGAFGLLAG